MERLPARLIEEWRAGEPELLGVELTAEMEMVVAFTHCLGSNGCDIGWQGLVRMEGLARVSGVAQWRARSGIGGCGRWRQCEATGRAETLKRRATTGAKRCRASLQARARAAEAGRALKCRTEPGRGGASGEETGRWQG